MENIAPQQDIEITWQPHPGPQTAMIACPVFELFFGGARGGGKTAGMLGDWANHSSMYGEDARGLMVRRSRTELVDTIQESKLMYRQLGAKFHEQDKIWTMPNGAVFRFAFLENDADADVYQGHNYTRVYCEEIGAFPSPDPIMKLMATLRSAKGVPVGFRATGNPGGAGHQWVKARYIDPAPSGYAVIPTKFINPFTKQEVIKERIFIPSKLPDNPSLGDDYVAALSMVGSKELVRAWLEGDWSVITGAYFPEFSYGTHVVPTMQIPEHWTRIRGMDWGSRAPFAVIWGAISDGEPLKDGRGVLYWLPRNSIVCYREWYGWNGNPNKGCGMMAQEVGAHIKEIERDAKERMNDEVLDPAAFSSDGGPSIAERLDLNFRRADNKRVVGLGRSGGWDAVRERLRGTDQSEGKPLLYFMDNCVHTIRTLPALQHDTLRPEDVDTTGEDHCFVEDTLVNTDKGVYPIAGLIGVVGKVRSSDGEWHDFRSARLTRKNEPTVRLRFSDGSTIQCTHDHGFHTSLGLIPAWKLAGHQTLRCSVRPVRNSWAGAIISAARTFVRKAHFCTAMFGLQIAEISLLAGTFITKTTIKPIIQSTTWTACRELIISVASMGMNQQSAAGNTWSGHNSPPENGMLRSWDANGTSGTIGVLNQSFAQDQRIFANSAEMNFRPSPGSFAPIIASLPPDAPQGSITYSKLAWFAEGRSWLENIQRSKAALLGVAAYPALEPGPVCLEVKEAQSADVYCITVPDTGNFALASGQIVSNCGDATRYLCMSRPLTRKRSTADNPHYLYSHIQAPTINELLKRQRNKRMELQD